LWVNGDRMRGIEAGLANSIAIPLIDELAVLVEVNDTRRSLVVGGVGRIHIVRAFIAMTFGDEDVVMGPDRDVQGLPQQPLVPALDPVAPVAALTDRQKQFSLRADFHNQRTVGGS